MPVEERQNINFDHPDAFDWGLLSKHVSMLREGKSIEQPTYSYLTCTRQPETIHIEPREVIIIEGILALCDKKLRNMMDLRIFVDADPDERLIRVIQRDVVERGRTAEAVMERYTRILKPMHLQFIEPCKRYADLIVPEGGNNQVAIDILTMYIKKSFINNSNSTYGRAYFPQTGRNFRQLFHCQLLIALVLLCSVMGCRGNHNAAAEQEEAVDLQQIKDNGELVVLTLYSSTSYFIYRGQDMGFQYELGEQFAKKPRRQVKN